MSTLFNVRRLDVRAFAQAGELLSGQASLSEMPRLQADCAGVSPDRQIQWSAKGGLQAQVNAPAKVWLQVKATTALPFVCQRCLEPVEITVAVERDFRFVSSERLAEEEDQLAEEDLLVESREFDLLDGQTHRGIAFFSQGHLNRFIHAYHLTGQHLGGLRMAEFLQSLRQANKQQMRLGVLIQEVFAGGQGHRWTMIASHAVNGNRDHGTGLSEVKTFYASKQRPEATDQRSTSGQDGRKSGF